MKETILKLLLDEIYNKVLVVAEVIEKIPSLKIVLEQAAANDKGLPTPISAYHLKNAFDCIAQMRKEKVEQDKNLTSAQKLKLKTIIQRDTDARCTFAKDHLRSLGRLEE